MEVLEDSKTLINSEKVKQKFWDMFIIDSIIGNTDRHNDNWGFILNKENVYQKKEKNFIIKKLLT